MKSKSRSNRSTKSSPDDKFLTKLVTTNLKGTDAKRTVVLPATSASYIDWGDGTIIENPSADDLEHTYEGTGEYTIQAVFDWDNSSGITNWSKANKLSWLADVTQFGQKTYGDSSGPLLKSGEGAFAGFAGKSISALSELDTKNLSSMYRMFSGARLFNQSLGDNFLHGGITNAFAMFSDANVFNNAGEASIGQWNTSNVTYMRSMFEGAGLFDQDLSDWDTSAVRDPQNESEKGGMENMFKNTPSFAADLSGWNVKNLDPRLNADFNTNIGSNKQGEWPNFGEDPTPPSIFPDDYQQGDDFIVNDGKPIRVENSIEFGAGNDLLINTCMLQVGGAGLIDLGLGRDQMETNSWISARTLDGGDGVDRLTLTRDDVCNGGARDENLSAQSLEIDNFERIEVTGGIWQFEGDHRKADVLISGGTMQIPLQERSQVGLKADRLSYKDGEISVALDLNDVSSPTKGRWNVIKGLSRRSRQLLQNDLNQLSLDLIGSGPDDSSLEPDWIFRGDKLLLSITDGF